MPDPNQSQSPSSSATAAASTAAPSPAWFDAFAEVKADPALSKIASTYKSPVDAVKALGRGFGDSWREGYARDDKAKLERLQRFTSPDAAFDALLSAQDRIRSGELTKPLPENANEQEIAEYRKERGIPEKPEGYLANLPDGLVIGEEDLPVFERMAARLHAKNLPPEVAHENISLYNELVEEAKVARAEADQQEAAKLEDEMRSEWGNGYRANVAVMNNFISTMPPEVQALWQDERALQGSALFNNVVFVKWFAQLARNQVGGTMSMVDSNGQPMGGKGLDDFIAQEEKFMREHNADYFRDDARSARLNQAYAERIKRDERTARQSSSG